MRGTEAVVDSGCALFIAGDIPNCNAKRLAGIVVSPEVVQLAANKANAPVIDRMRTNMFVLNIGLFGRTNTRPDDGSRINGMGCFLPAAGSSVGGDLLKGVGPAGATSEYVFAQPYSKTIVHCADLRQGVVTGVASNQSLTVQV